MRGYTHKKTTPILVDWGTNIEDTIMTQTTQKIQGQFYPLTPDYTQHLRKAKLTAAEWRIWSYLVEIDPWGDKYHDLDLFNVMSECDSSKATFYRAIAKFQDLGLFDFQNQGFSFKNETGTERLRKGYLKNETTVSKMRQPVSKMRQPVSKMRQPVSKMRQESQKCENQTPECPSNNGSSSSQTIQTYSDFIKTLSDSERERFFEFVEEKTKNFPHAIMDLEAWLAKSNSAGRNRWEIYYQRFVKAQTIKSPPKQHRPLRDEIEKRRQYVLEYRRKQAEAEAAMAEDKSKSTSEIEEGQSETEVESNIWQVELEKAQKRMKNLLKDLRPINREVIERHSAVGDGQEDQFDGDSTPTNCRHRADGGVLNPRAGSPDSAEISSVKEQPPAECPLLSASQPKADNPITEKPVGERNDWGETI